MGQKGWSEEEVKEIQSKELITYMTGSVWSLKRGKVRKGARKIRDRRKSKLKDKRTKSGPGKEEQMKQN